MDKARFNVDQESLVHFEASRADDPTPFAFIRAGEVIGEIGFFAGTPRTANVTATRDATVLALDRTAYDRIAEDMPTAGDAGDAPDEAPPPVEETPPVRGTEPVG